MKTLEQKLADNKANSKSIQERRVGFHQILREHFGSRKTLKNQ